MSETAHRDAFIISASEGMVLVEAPGLVATVDIDAASLLSGQLLAARLQQHAAVRQESNSGPSSSG
jgi:hypothetical protein